MKNSDGYSDIPWRNYYPLDWSDEIKKAIERGAVWKWQINAKFASAFPEKDRRQEALMACTKPENWAKIETCGPGMAYDIAWSAINDIYKSHMVRLEKTTFIDPLRLSGIGQDFDQDGTRDYPSDEPSTAALKVADLKGAQERQAKTEQSLILRELLDKAAPFLKRAELEVINGYLEGKHFSQIAKEHGLAESTVRSRFKKALKTIRAIARGEIFVRRRRRRSRETPIPAGEAC
jgi:DNA-directed RNA polymerase specialized sigma24 family protein